MVILPAAVLLFVFKWLFGMVLSGIRPVTQTLVKESNLGVVLATVIALGVIVGGCFLLGLIIKTKLSNTSTLSRE